jgi:hypothetical protein
MLGVVPAGVLLPVRVVSRLFRRLSLGKLRAAHQAGGLAFSSDQAPSRSREISAFLASLPKA